LRTKEETALSELSARVPLVEPEDLANEEERAIYNHVAKARGGRQGTIFKVLANSPGALQRAAAIGEWMRESTLKRSVQELAVLTTAHELHCQYEWNGHYGFAKRLGERIGYPAELLEVTGTRKAEEFAAPFGPVARFARLVARGDEVDDATFAATKDAVGGDRGIVELVVLVGYYALLARVVSTLHVPSEGPREPAPMPAYA
jgi:alkylhydroperoxidase family enzyme